MADLEKLKDISIVDYARQIGFTPIKVGRYYSLKEHDSVRIDTSRNVFFRNSTGKKGSIIDFVMAMRGISLGAAIKELNGNLGSLEPTEKREKNYPDKDKPTSLQLPNKASSMKNVFAYLVKTRCISQKLVQELVDRDMLYQDDRNNCVFVSRNEENIAVFATIRGTNTYKRWVGDVYGCDYSHSFFIDNGANKLVVTESVIDALSFMDVMNQRGNYHLNYNYLALSGTGKAKEAIEYHIEKEKYGEVLLALDSDTAGKRITAEMVSHINEIKPEINVSDYNPEIYKDWNEALVDMTKTKKERIKERDAEI